MIKIFPHNLLLLVSAILLFLGTAVHDCAYGNDSGFPFITNYSPYEYERHVQNWGFTQDSNGVLYLANTSGPMVYDGVNWHQFIIPNNHCMAVHYNGNGRVYTGGSNELGYIKTSDANGAFSSVNTRYVSLRDKLPEHVQFSVIWDIIDDGTYTYFFSPEFLMIYDGSEFSYHSHSVGFRGLVKIDGNVYVRKAATGLFQVTPDSLIRVPEYDFFKETPLQAHLRTGNKDIYCSHERCYEFTGTEFSHFETEADHLFADAVIQSAIVLQDGSLLFATRNRGLVHLDSAGRLIRLLDESTGLINNSVFGIHEDAAGSVWVATVNGFSRVDFGLPLRRYDHRNGLSENIYDLIRGHQGLKIASGSGLLELVGGRNLINWNITRRCDHFATIHNQTYAICENELFRLDEQSAVSIDLPQGLKLVAEIADTDLIAFIYDAQILIGRIIGDRLNVSDRIDDIALYAHSVITDVNHNFWFGTNAHGLQHLELWFNDDGNLIGYVHHQYFQDIENEVQNRNVSVARLRGTPAFLTYGAGIQRFNHDTGEMELVEDFGPFFADTSRQFFGAAEDIYGNVWFRFDQRFHAALFSGDDYQLYHGFLNRINDTQINRIYPDDHGYVWIASDRGLIRINTRKMYNHEREFYTQVSRVIVHGDTLSTSDIRSNPVTLSYSENQIRFTLASNSFESAADTEYRVKLTGLDEDWSFWTNETWKDYTNLSEGSYEFRVQARNVYGTVSEAATFSFTILPPWYRTWWAYIMYVLAFGGVLYTAYTIRINRLLREQNIRNSIAGDLHDEVSATLSSISYFARAIEHDNGSDRFIKLIAESAGEAKEKISDIVWAINPEHDEWESFLSKCRRFTSDLLDSCSIKYNLRIDEHIPGKLDMEFRQHLWMIYKEMITNAVRHSKCTRMDVILTTENRKITLIVQDDGVGFTGNEKQFGNGISNIKRRALQIKANVELHSDPGMGTRWKLTVKTP